MHYGSKRNLNEYGGPVIRIDSLPVDYTAKFTVDGKNWRFNLSWIQGQDQGSSTVRVK